MLRCFEIGCGTCLDLKIDSGKIVISSDSTGDNLAAAVALMAQDREGLSTVLQLLFHPALDDRCTTQSMMRGAGLYTWNLRIPSVCGTIIYARTGIAFLPTHRHHEPRI